jgi:hypothetical protein
VTFVSLIQKKEGITDENFTLQKIIVGIDFFVGLGGPTLGDRTIIGSR